MPEKPEKIRTGFYIEAELLKKCDTCLSLANASSRNEFVNEAIRKYIGSLEARDSQQYLASYITDAIAGAVGVSENRIARLLFKQAVPATKGKPLAAGGMPYAVQRLKQIRQDGDNN